MTDTTFVDKVTTIATTWLQDMNNFVYRQASQPVATVISATDTVPISITGGPTWKVITWTNILNTILNTALHFFGPIIFDGTVTCNSTLTGTLTGNITGNAATASNLTGTPAFFAPITNSLGADVSLNNVSNYFDGPSVAQGVTGKWFVSGTVTVGDTAVAAVFNAKLWDGTTVIASTETNAIALNKVLCISLSGFISNPAGNLRISVQDVSSTSGKIIYNTTTLGKDSTITAVRVG